MVRATKTNTINPQPSTLIHDGLLFGNLFFPKLRVKVSFMQAFEKFF